MIVDCTPGDENAANEKAINEKAINEKAAVLPLL
jgi:hypothetical protein